MSKEPINTPKRIFLNIGCEGETADFDYLSEVSWSREKIHSDDIEYTLSSDTAHLKEALREMVKMCDTFGIDDHYLFPEYQEAIKLLNEE